MWWYILQQRCQGSGWVVGRLALVLRICSELATVGDGDLCLRGTVLCAHCFHFLYNIHALNDTTKHHVLSIQPWCLVYTDEKLRPIGVCASVGHGQDSFCCVLQGEVL